MSRTKDSKPKSTTVVDMRRPRRDAGAILSVLSGGNPNAGRMSPQEYRKAYSAFADGSGPGIVLYQPALMELAADGSGLVAVCGRGTAQPAEWSENQLGKWHGVADDAGTVTGGDVINKVRLHHNRNLARRCDPDALVTLNGIGQVVLGIHGVNPQTTGNYLYIVETAKVLIFGEDKQLSKLVGVINADCLTEKLEHGGEIVWNPGNVITWGYIVRGDNRLTHDQIRKGASADTFDGSFEPLDAPIVGTPIPVGKLVTAVRAAMSKAATKRNGDDATALDRFGYEEAEAERAAISVNITTLTRHDPRSLGCFGLRNVQTGIPMFFTFSEDGDTKMVNMVVGIRLPINYAENAWDAKARIKAANPEPEPAPAKPRTPRKRKAVEAVTVDVVTDAPVADPADGTVAPPVEDTAEAVVDPVDVTTDAESLTVADVDGDPVAVG